MTLARGPGRRYRAAMQPVFSRIALAVSALAIAVTVPASAAKTAGSAARPPAGAVRFPAQQVIPPAQRQCSGKTASGLGTRMLRAAAGPVPGPRDGVLVNYIGYFAATGEVFDQNQRSAFPVDGVVKGFGEGLQLVGKGGIIRLCVPAALGYGARQVGPIPANSDLVFQVELLDFRTEAEIEAMRRAGGGE